MKQKKNTRSNTKTSNRNYFNPYETVTPLNDNRAKRKTPRNTYEKVQRASSLQKSDQKIRLKSDVNRLDKVSRKKTTTTESKKAKKRQVVQKTGTKSNNSSPKYTTYTEYTMPPKRQLQVKKKAKLTKTQRMRLKRRRQMQAFLRITVVMCLTIGLIWGGFRLKEFFTRPVVSHQVVKMGSLDTSTLFEGVVFRNEKIITSEDEGYAKYIVAEGEKVEKDGIVYVLVDEENLATTTTAKEEVESQIYTEAEHKAATSNNQDKRYNLDQEVKSRFEEFYNNRYDSSTSNIYTLRSKLDSSITNRTNLYTAEQEATNQELVELKQDIEAHMERYQKGKAVTESGIISYHMDGYETENAKQAIGDLTYKTYNQYRKAASTTSLAPSTLNKEDPIYKLVSNNEWYVVTYIDTKDDQWTQGQSYQLNFDDVTTQKIQFTLISKKEEENRIQLVFKGTNQINSFLGVRNVSFSIGDKDTKGLKIPLEAVVELNLIKIPKEYVVTENNVEGVKRKKGNHTEFVALEVQNQNEDMYYMIQDLTDAQVIQLKDTLVHPQTGKAYEVTESEVVKGVYVINSQIAKFKEVEILTQNDEYALVKYNAKSQLKEMDKIISNPKSIKKDQLLEDMKIQNE